MRYLLFALLLFFSQFISAGNFTDYRDHVAKDRVLIIFDNGVSAERKEQIINSSGIVTSFTHLPSPALTICFTPDADKASRFFSAIPEV